jgi:hypothetical protein
MKLRVLLSAFTVFGLGCTAFIAANLSNSNGTIQNKVGGCFNLDDTTCGECIANNCEDPSNTTQPVSLQKVCQLNQYATIISATQACSKSASVEDYNCQAMYIDGGTYSTSIDTEQAAVNNLKQCITQKCTTSCSRCAVNVPTCGNDTIDLLEAGTCGTCIDQAMNQPGSVCQKYILGSNGLCSESSSGFVAQCAIPSGSCQSADCSNLSSPSTNLTDAGYAYVTCLWGQCGPNGTNACPSP